MKKKTRHLTPEEQADVDFLLKTPGLKVSGVGGGRIQKDSPFYDLWKEQNGKK